MRKTFIGSLPPPLTAPTHTMYSNPRNYREDSKSHLSTGAQSKGSVAVASSNISRQVQSDGKKEGQGTGGYRVYAGGETLFRFTLTKTARYVVMQRIILTSVQACQTKTKCAF